MKRALLAALLLAASCGGGDDGPTDEDFARAGVSRCNAEYSCWTQTQRETAGYPCLTYEETLRLSRNAGNGDGTYKPTREESLKGYNQNLCFVDFITSNGCGRAIVYDYYSDELKAACCDGDCAK